MSDTFLFFLAGLTVTVLYGLSWLTRKREGGQIFGYHSVWDALAPFATAVGVLMMLISLLLWLFQSNTR